MSLPSVSLGGVVREELPFPFVHYPGHYGTFFAFSETGSGTPFLCECSKTAIRNYVALKQLAITEESEDPYSAAHKHFSSEFSQIIRCCDDSLRHLQFRRAICHRCNLVPPTMRYCHEMYGVEFIQRFGWYVNQACLRFGILPISYIYLQDVTPKEYADDIMRIRQVRTELQEAQEWFRKREEQTRQRIRGSAEPCGEDGPAYAEITRRQALLREAQRKVRRAERTLTRKIENIVRIEFGYKEVGESWTSETLLFQIVCNIFPGHEALRHHRPGWLEGLELDIFLPGKNIAFEYQGQQHFHPIEAWGGEQALDELQERDAKKARICKERGIKLITVDYTEPLTREHILGYVSTQIDGLDKDS